MVLWSIEREFIVSGTKPAGMTGAGIVVKFDTDNTLRVTFKTDGSRTLGDNTFLLDGTDTVPKKSGKNGYLQVENIVAPNLDTVYTFTVADGKDTYTVTASALSYAYTSVKNGDSARQNLGKVLYFYNRAADAYFSDRLVKEDGLSVLFFCAIHPNILAVHQKKLFICIFFAIVRSSKQPAY